MLKKPSHDRRFSKLLWGMIRLDDLEENFEANRTVIRKSKSTTFEVRAKKTRVTVDVFLKLLWGMIRFEDLE